MIELLRRVYLVLILTSISSLGYAQTGIIRGVIKDFVTYEPIPGVNVVIEGSTIGAVTNIEGEFAITKAPAGVHTVVISYIGYEPVKIGNVRVEAGRATIISTTIKESTTNTQEVEVVAQKLTNTNVSIVTEVRKAEQVAVGVSAEQISQTQDRDVAQVLKRVPGLALVDDRFAMIRGLSERYNTTMLNDVIAPSMEVDSRAFSFDLLPSSIIERVMIYKTGSADLPGEFAGGVIKIYTKNIPDRNQTEFSFSSGYRAGTTFSNYQSQPIGQTDWLGFDNSLRQVPDNFPSTQRLQSDNFVPTDAEINAYKDYRNNWAYTSTPAQPDLRANLLIARKMAIAGIQIGNITNISYSNTYQSYQNAFNRYEAYNAALGKSDTNFSYTDKVFSNNVRLGVVHNWSAVFSPKHKLDFKNFFTQLGTTENTFRDGKIKVQGSDIQSYAFRYESRMIYSGQLSGTHDFSERLQLKWTTGFGFTNRQEPDYRRVRYTRESTPDPDFGLQPFTAIFGRTVSLTDAARFSSKLNERIYTLNVGVTYKLNPEEEDEEKQIKVRTGVFGEFKNRQFNARLLGYTSSNFNLGTKPIDQIFAADQIGLNGFLYGDGTNPTDAYLASNNLMAGYVNVYWPITKQFNVSAGIRLEHNHQKLNSTGYGGASIEYNKPVLSPLPSLNLTYNINEKHLIRTGYFISVNRPEFREVAPFNYYDFSFERSILGNDSLQVPTIHNLDLRWEFYPSKGEVITFGGFVKRFNNPIEATIIPGSSELNMRPRNANYATSLGLELELRKSLNFIGPQAIWSDLSVVCNATVINNVINLGDRGGVEASSRPMYAQSPYLVNAGLYYQSDKYGFQANVLYNVVGPRIWAVGNFRFPAVYEMPRNVIDLNFAKEIGKYLEFRLSVKDLLNQPMRLLQDSNGDGKPTNADESIMNYNTGTYSTVGITVKL